MKQSFWVHIDEAIFRKEASADAKDKLNRKEKALGDVGISIKSHVMKRNTPDENASLSKQQKAHKVSRGIIDFTGEKALVLLEK